MYIGKWTLLLNAVAILLLGINFLLIKEYWLTSGIVCLSIVWLLELNKGG